ncbi:MAG: hypothetical protein NC408_04295 [Candidatus Gastranaerophilales bacterium]|nr:hypothetical protein [Candidatus Gastranaerophilales bacterium]MCM1073836.1 hypothetical protein [Bacteroides sp.]
MNIQPTQNYSAPFKSGFPVTHWVRETNGSYAPALSRNLNEKLQRSVVRLLNSNIDKSKPEKRPLIEYVKKIISASDSDFAQNPVARSFYFHHGGLSEQKFEPFGYILTGRHAEHMTEVLGKPIGRAKSDAPRRNGNLADTAEINIAVGDYFNQGINFVKKLASHFKLGGKTRYGLHTKFEVIRTKTGRIKEYRLIDLKFCPEEGAGNPFVRTGYLKK